MKSAIFLLLAILMSIFSCKQPDKSDAISEEIVEDLIEEEQPEQVLRHVVLFKFKDSATEADVDEIVEAFKKLPEQIDGILDFEWGEEISPEGIADGYTHVFLVTFKDEQARDAYLPHPDHKAFGEILGPHLDRVLVVDYWTQE